MKKKKATLTKRTLDNHIKGNRWNVKPGNVSPNNTVTQK